MQKTAYEMRISDWSSDVCSSDLAIERVTVTAENLSDFLGVRRFSFGMAEKENKVGQVTGLAWTEVGGDLLTIEVADMPGKGVVLRTGRSEEHTSELQSLMRISYAVFCLKKKTLKHTIYIHTAYINNTTTIKQQTQQPRK